MKTDPTTLKFNQISIIAICTVALIGRMPWLVAGLALLMLLGSQHPRLAVFKQLWERALRPAIGLKANLVDDDPRAHNFAQLVGGIVLSAAAIAFFTGWTATATALTLTVIALALLNLTTSICVGCLLYYQYNMLRYRLSNGR